MYMYMFQGYGSFSGFIMSMYVMYLLSQRKLNIHMSSYQVMRNTLLRLCKYDLTLKGNCYTFKEDNSVKIVFVPF